MSKAVFWLILHDDMRSHFFTASNKDFWAFGVADIRRMTASTTAVTIVWAFKVISERIYSTLGIPLRGLLSPHA